MALRQLHHADRIANADSALGWIIVAIYSQFLQFANGTLRHIRHKASDYSERHRDLPRSNRFRARRPD